MGKVTLGSTKILVLIGLNILDTFLYKLKIIAGKDIRSIKIMIL
ncbi:hypothetical protein EU97_0830 [Prochlorococcus marinus str. MIT 9311]|nr:hypothetical protein EU97_0830 [Prochlorococcus marinus str. MIT 9311]